MQSRLSEQGKVCAQFVNLAHHWTGPHSDDHYDRLSSAHIPRDQEAKEKHILKDSLSEWPGTAGNLFRHEFVDQRESQHNSGQGNEAGQKEYFACCFLQLHVSSTWSIYFDRSIQPESAARCESTDRRTVEFVNQLGHNHVSNHCSHH